MSHSKYFYFLVASLKSIRRNKFTALSIALPLTFIIAIVSALTFYMEGVEKDAMTAAKAFPDILLQQQVGGRTESLLLDRYLDILDNTKEISSYVPRVWGYINYTDAGGTARAFVLMGLDPEFMQSGKLFNTTIETGRALANNDTDSALVGIAIAKAFNAKAGDTIDISRPGGGESYPLEIVGTFDADVQIYTADLIIVPTETARKVLGFYAEFECSDVLIYLNDPSTATEVGSIISRTVEGARPLTREVVMGLTELSFGQRSGFFHMLWFILLINVLLIGWSVMSNLSHAQKKEIGILKAIGWDTQDIMALKLIEITIITAFSVLSGLLSGIVFMLAGAPGIKKYIIGWAEIYADFPIPLYVEWQTVFLITAVGSLPLICATLIPIWRISIVDPIEAIR